ncbi:hypothetical protein [Herbiconiux flava]|uniref:Uncharacterized protein n=1 Tax=Herbiconiux flava TaxID=881268 RepID=A0A852SC26_9MICO|nr:hypothetical protein [Herbiconiux flava]NYD69962.1 hypothetical protein [Herbiconiux flava]
MVSLLGGLLLVLTACSPSIIGTLGIARLDDGSLDVLIRICRGSIDDLGLEAVGPLHRGATDEPDDSSWESIPDQEVTLSPSVTASGDVALPFDEGSVQDEVRYKLRSSGSEGNAFSAAFTSSDLDAIKPGRVLTPASGDQIESPLLTPQQFEEYATEFCD